MTVLRPPLHVHCSSNNSQSGSIEPAEDAWHLLTGHRNGQVQVWTALEGRPLKALVVLAPTELSPIKFLVVLEGRPLCCAHANGKLTLCHTASQALSVMDTGHDLPVITLLHAECQAHLKGICQCVRCDTGMLSVGASRTILM